MSGYKAYNYCELINRDNINSALVAIEKFCNDNIANVKYYKVIEALKRYNLYEYHNYYIDKFDINTENDEINNATTEAEAGRYGNIINSLLYGATYNITIDIKFINTENESNDAFLALLGYVINTHKLSLEYILETILYYETYEAVDNRKMYIHYLAAITYCGSINIIQPRNLQSEYSKALYCKDNFIHNLIKDTYNSVCDTELKCLPFIALGNIRSDTRAYILSKVYRYVYDNKLKLNVKHLTALYMK